MDKCKECRHLCKLNTRIESLKDRVYMCNKYRCGIRLRFKEDIDVITCIEVIKGKVIKEY